LRFPRIIERNIRKHTFVSGKHPLVSSQNVLFIKVKGNPEAFDEKIENGQGRARRMHSEYNDGGSIYSPRLTKKDRTDVRALPNDEERDIVSRADSKRNAVERHMINKIRKERY
jgi:hypothetical protein